MSGQIPLTDAALADLATPQDGTHEVAPDLAYLRVAMVNVVLFGPSGAGDREWVLIDTGIPGMAGRIENAAEKRFGKASRPAAILLTHGHFDHIGNLEKLAEDWDAPIYAHPLEAPFLDGRERYAPPDLTVGGGIMPLLAPLFPRGPFNVGSRLKMVAQDGTLPGMPGWRWLHTPGHSPGHVSLWQESTRTVIAGDAFITTKQESAYAIAVQALEMHGPPTSFTPDWTSARSSVQTLAALAPDLMVTGHGRGVRGPEATAALQKLAAEFDRVAIPAGRVP